MFVEQIRTALGTKYASFGLSKEAVDAIALQVEKTVEKEENIEGSIASYETMNLVAKEVQKMRDRELRQRSDLQKSFDEYKKANPAKGGEEKNDDDNPVLKELRELRARIDKREQDEKSRATLSSVTNALKKAGCTNDEILSLSLKGFSLGENETEEAAVARIKSDYDSSVKKIFGNGPVPPIGGGGPKGDDDYVKTLQAYAEKKGLKKED